MRFKHKVHNVKDLIDKVTAPMVIYGKNEMIPPGLTKCRSYNTGNFRIPNKTILVNVTKGYTTDSVTIHLQFSSLEYQQYSYIVSSDFNIIELTGVAGKSAMKLYNEYKETNIHKFLSHYFMIGADPEVFVTDDKDNLIPAFNFLGSKKDTTVKTSNECKVYWDGFQAEFETLAGTCLQGLVSEVRRGLFTTLDAAKKVNPAAKLSLNTVMQIPADLLRTSADDHVSLGCMPSLNVYKHKGEDVPDPRQLLVRSTGGHIHFGVGKLPEQSVTNIVKALDAILGVACVSLFAKYDNPIRRRYYGLAGEYRLPPHGIEYRVLSNAWMAHPFITHLVYGLARKALKVGELGYLNLWKATEEEVIECINNCDVKAAQAILNKNKNMFMSLLRAAGYGNDAKDRELLFNIFINGMESVVSDPNNIVSNWKIANSNELGTVGVGYSEVRHVLVQDKVRNKCLGIKIA